MVELATNRREGADASVGACAELGLIELQGGQHQLLHRLSIGQRARNVVNTS